MALVGGDLSWLGRSRPSAQDSLAEASATSCRAVVVVGEPASGKQSLVQQLSLALQQHLQGPLHPRCSTAGSWPLAYSHLSAQGCGTPCDVGLWCLQGAAPPAPFLRLLLPPPALSNRLLLITLDISKPWLALGVLKKWTASVRQAVEPSTAHRPAEKPLGFGADQEQTSTVDSSTAEQDLGVHSVVVGTKVDLLPYGQRGALYSEDEWKVFQVQLYRACRSIGARLFLTSTDSRTGVTALAANIAQCLEWGPSQALEDAGDNRTWPAFEVPEEHKLASEGAAFRGQDCFQDVLLPPAPSTSKGRTDTQQGRVNSVVDIVEDEQTVLRRLKKVLETRSCTRGVPEEKSCGGASGKTSTDSRPGTSSQESLEGKREVREWEDEEEEEDDEDPALFFASLLQKGRT